MIYMSVAETDLRSSNGDLARDGVKGEHDGEAYEMGPKHKTIAGSGGGSMRSGSYRAEVDKFCRSQIICLTMPAYAEGADWPGRPIGCPRGLFAGRLQRHLSATSSWGGS